MSLLQDLRFAIRILAKRPWLTCMIVLVLATGIGINATVFTLFNAVLIRGLPFPQGDRILFVDSNNLPKDRDDIGTSYPDYADWRDSTKAFQLLAAFSGEDFNLSDDSAAAQRVDGSLITTNAFRALRMQPILGRDFAPEDAEPGANPVVIIGHGMWRSRYASDPNITGKSVRLDERPYTIIGVMPQGYRFPDNADIWAPLVPQGDWLKRDNRRMGVFGRLADGATLTAAQGELDVVAERLSRQYPITNDGIGVHVLTANANFNGGQIRSLFLAMLGAVGFVLLIACANVANVQLTRAAAREQEISIRTALGAGRWRIVRQLLIESLLLSFAGGLAGLGLSLIGVRLFDNATASFRPFFIHFDFDAAVFAYLAAICVVTGVLFGLAPAIHAIRSNVNLALKEGSRGQSGSKGAGRFSSFMVIGEVALSVVLLAGAGLLVRSFWNIYTMDIGVETDHRLIGRVALPQLKYPDAAERLAFHQAVLQELRAIPGARQVATASHLPANGFSGRQVEIEGQPLDAGAEAPSEALVVIDPEYFNAMGVTLAQGRGFQPADGLNAPQVAIVSRGFAEKYWPAADPLGKRLRLGDEAERPWLTVVGISPNIRQNGMESAEARPLVYRPFAQEPRSFFHFLIDTAVQPATLAPAFRDAIASVDPHLPVEDLMTLEERMQRSRWGFRVFGTVFSVFAAVALTLAAVGVFALVADSVRRRVPEFGIRLALGAAPAQILNLVLSHALRRVVAGVLIGLPLAFAGAQILGSTLVGVEPGDPLTLGGGAAFLLSIALLACWLPARRVTQIDPSTALRHE